MKNVNAKRLRVLTTQSWLLEQLNMQKAPCAKPQNALKWPNNGCGICRWWGTP